jgi:isopenicillin-N N-acyltransferase-like protein
MFPENYKPMIEPHMNNDPPRRHLNEGIIPLLDVEGTAFECGRALGHAWREALILESKTYPPASRPWWRDPAFSTLISQNVPHLPDLYCGMARSIGIAPDRLGARTLLDSPSHNQDGCTSFAIAPSAGLDGHLICGQTKDAPVDRYHRYVVLRMRLTDAPSSLTLTYPGMLFGHGFVCGGCSIFRNSLYAGVGEGQLPYDAWGLLSLHCPTVEQAIELTQRHGVAEAFHSLLADEHGGIAGIENGKGGTAVLRARDGIYTHANTCSSNDDLRQYEEVTAEYLRNSQHRENRLRHRLEADRGRLTAQLVFAALCDHEGYPDSVCNHHSDEFLTSASVIAEPQRRRLSVTRGSPCQNWPYEYTL